MYIYRERERKRERKRDPNSSGWGGFEDRGFPGVLKKYNVEILGFN